MKRNIVKMTMLVAALGTAVSCGGDGSPKKEIMKIDNSLTAEEISKGILSPEVMWKMGRVAASSISPDGKEVVFTVTNYNMAENKGETSLYMIPFEGGDVKRLTDGGGNDSGPVWSPDGTVIYFTSNRSGDAQAWKYDVGSGNITQVSNVDGGLEGFGISPDGSKAWYVKKVHVTNTQSSEVYPDMDKSKALIYDDLMARHWDYWDRGRYSHIHVADISGGKFGSGRDIMEGEPWDAPMAPYFDTHEITWDPSGTKVAYTCKKMTGTEYAVSTDSDVYIYDIATGETANITKGMPGYDKYPVFSPDGRYVAFTSMERPGNEADKDRLFIHDLSTGTKSYITSDFDYNASNIVWNGNSLLFIAPMEGTHQICEATLDGQVKPLTAGDHDINSFSKAGDRLVCQVTRIDMATELFTADLAGNMNRLTNINAHVYDNVKLGEVQKRWIRTTDGKDMLTWVILPPDFDPAKKYPTLLYCQGGPQSVVSQSWSYRWNFQLMAAQGYVVVAPNRRGLPSFGQEWLDQISGDYSGQNIRDYLSAIDDVAKEPWVDNDRLGCVGASYGGYSVFYLAGHHNKRFKGLIAHCGIFNFESMYGETEELFFVNNDYGGSYWSENPVAKRSYANSPHKAVQNWDTPILIITGLNDFRIPYTQSLQAFTAARLRGIPAKLVAFENEAHQVFQPQNSLVWNREFFGWLDKYVKNTQK